MNLPNEGCQKVGKRWPLQASGIRKCYPEVKLIAICNVSEDYNHNNSYHKYNAYVPKK